jgi:hypothetical protein
VLNGQVIKLQKLKFPAKIRIMCLDRKKVSVVLKQRKLNFLNFILLDIYSPVLGISLYQNLTTQKLSIAVFF